MAKKCIVIGSGAAGLATGIILSGRGYDVTVLEQHSRIGGCLQCFRRGDAVFDTGMHFVGSIREGEILRSLLRFLGVDGIELSELDRTAYETVSLGGERFDLANGREAFIDGLCARFPGQRTNLDRFFDAVTEASAVASVDYIFGAPVQGYFESPYQTASVNQVMDGIFGPSPIADVLVGNLPLFGGMKDRTPFSRYACVMNFYNQSAARIVGGSHRLADMMADVIRSNGGKVVTDSRVTQIVCDGTRATGVVVNDSDFISADVIVADIHPARVLELLKTPMIRPAYRSRILSLDQSRGVFSLFLKFKPERVPYLNSNFYHYDDQSPWGSQAYDGREWPRSFLYMHHCDEADQKYARTAVVLSDMDYAEVERWSATRVGHRGDDYEEFKRLKAERLLAKLEAEFPGIRADIESYFTATPLTYRDYTGTERGGIYGIAADLTRGIAGRVSYRTKVPNLLLTGQNTNSHGILGVFVSAIVTCSDLTECKD